jgi:uncharacterized membrane protein
MVGAALLSIFTKGFLMKKATFKTIILFILIGAGIAAYLYFQHDQTITKPQPVDVPDVKSATLSSDNNEPNTRQILNEPEEEITLPQLGSSDNFMAAALEKLLNNKALMGIFINNQLINNIVVTIDNLPRKQVTMRLMPIKKAPGHFLTTESEGQKIISLENQMRYSNYMKLAESIDSAQLVKLYIQLYPLFQQSYEQLGYPNQYFNDRLMVVIDNLLATPEVSEPIPLVQPKFFYLYANAELEKRSIGQRILMRIGLDNAQMIKAKLNEIKQALMLHMHEQKVEAIKTN